MNQISIANKDLVRQWLARRRREQLPPPSPEQLRIELDWKLVEKTSTPVAMR
jgi:hypothetical protein